MEDKELIEDFLKHLPEFNDIAQTIYAQWHPHNPDEEFGMSMGFFEYTNGFVIELLIKMENMALLKRIFDYYEGMAASGDDLQTWVMREGILVRLSDDAEILKRAKTLMGTETLKMSGEVEIGPGRE